LNSAEGNIYIQDFQFEVGLVSTDYLESTSVTGKAGVLVDLPRINYDANGENGALLLEPSRVNFVQYSELGTNNSIQGGSITNNEITSPENYTNAFKFLESSANDNHGFYTTISLSSNTYYTASIFVKKLGRRYVGLQSWWSSTKGAIAYFDLDDVESKGTYAHGTNYSASDAKIESYGNDWYRISAVFQSGETTHYYGVVSMDSLWTTGTSYTNNYTGDTSKGFYAYGFQAELGSYPSSYIPNHGESGGVTRAADSCTTDDLQTLNVFNGSQGAVLFEGVKNGETIFSNFVVTANSNTNKSLLVDNSSGTIRLRVWNASSGQDATISTSSVDDGTFKYLIKWNAGSLAVYFNGSSVGTDTITAYSYTNVNLKEGTFSNNYIKQFTLFDEVPTDAECVTLTTL
jgi:hypothetical protein